MHHTLELTEILITFYQPLQSKFKRTQKIPTTSFLVLPEKITFNILSSSMTKTRSVMYTNSLHVSGPVWVPHGISHNYLFQRMNVYSLFQPDTI